MWLIDVVQQLADRLSAGLTQLALGVQEVGRQFGLAVAALLK